MIEVLSKPIDQISLDNIKSLIASKVPESEQIEFKETLPAKNKQDPWMNGEGKIGDHAKNALLRGVVAFANAYGGALLLGIKESDVSPSVATGISPIPQCADLVERLKLVFRDRIEPQLPCLEISTVPIKGDSGVIIIRAGRSHQAPHRIKGMWICPIRRADRCEEMSMREIQDMTLNLSRGLEQLDKKLLGRAECFQREFDYFRTPEDLLNAFGFRLTAAPVLDEIRFNTVFSHGKIPEELQKPAIEVLRKVKGSASPLHNLSTHRLFLHNWKPRLRAARAIDRRGFRGETDRQAYGEIHCDGLIEMGFVSKRSIMPPNSNQRLKAYLHAEVLVSMFANLVVWADQIRVQAQAPTAEYALEVEIGAFAGGVPVTLEDDIRPSAWGHLPPGSKTFPRYSFTDTEESSRLISLFERDFWNYAEKDFEEFQGTLEIQDIHG